MTSPLVFSSCFKTINYVHETWFSKHTFERTRWFLKICKIFDRLSWPKIRELLPQYERKNLVTTIFFEERLKEMLNIWLGYYFWECCFLYFVILNMFVFFKLIVVLNPHYFHIQEIFIWSLSKLCSLHYYFELTTRDFTLEN